MKDGFYRVMIKLKPGKHEYKYLVNGENKMDANHPIIPENGNYSLEINGRYRVYPNISKARQKLNLAHQKACLKYPEISVYQAVSIKASL